jgi:hypothetical protein
MAISTSERDVLGSGAAEAQTGETKPVDLLEWLKQEIDKEPEDSPLITKLKELKSSPSELEQAYMDIPKLITYYQEIKDGIPGPKFSGFGGLGAIEDLRDTLQKCTENLNEVIKAKIRDLKEKNYDIKHKELQKLYEKALDASLSGYSPVEKASESIKSEKAKYCKLAGLMYKEAGEEKKIDICEKEPDSDIKLTLEPPGYAARIIWWGTELVRMFKEVGITEDQALKSSFQCDSLTKPKVVLYAYLLEANVIIKNVKNSKDPKELKSKLNQAWQGWLDAVKDYYLEYNEEKSRRADLTQAVSKLSNFVKSREQKFVRAAQDVEGNGSCQ